jgi:hypothetical protein
MKELDMTHRKYSNEIKSLKEKLAWYAENQQLLEESENNKEALKNVINILKNELKKKGVSTDKIQYLILSVPGINLGSLPEGIGRISFWSFFISSWVERFGCSLLSCSVMSVSFIICMLTLLLMPLAGLHFCVGLPSRCNLF